MLMVHEGRESFFSSVLGVVGAACAVAILGMLQHSLLLRFGGVNPHLVLIALLALFLLRPFPEEWALYMAVGWTTLSWGPAFFREEFALFATLGALAAFRRILPWKVFAVFLFLTAAGTLLFALFTSPHLLLVAKGALTVETVYNVLAACVLWPFFLLFQDESPS